MQETFLLIHIIALECMLMLTFSQHISNLTRSSYFQLRRLRTIRKAVSVPIFTSIIHPFVCSRIDYCNSLLIGLPKTRLSRGGLECPKRPGKMSETALNSLKL